MTLQKVQEKARIFDVSEIITAPEAAIMALCSKCFENALMQLLFIEEKVGILNTVSTSDEALSVEEERSLSRIKKLKLEFKELLSREIRHYQLDPEGWFIENHQEETGELLPMNRDFGVGQALTT